MPGELGVLRTVASRPEDPHCLLKAGSCCEPREPKTLRVIVEHTVGAPVDPSGEAAAGSQPLPVLRAASSPPRWSDPGVGRGRDRRGVQTYPVRRTGRRSFLRSLPPALPMPLLGPAWSRPPAFFVVLRDREHTPSLRPAPNIRQRKASEREGCFQPTPNGRNVNVYKVRKSPVNPTNVQARTPLLLTGVGLIVSPAHTSRKRAQPSSRESFLACGATCGLCSWPGESQNSARGSARRSPRTRAN